MALTKEDLKEISELMRVQLEPIHKKLIEHDKKFDKIDERFNKIEKTIEKNRQEAKDDIKKLRETFL